MKRRMHEEDSMARMFREQLGKSLATYSTMCAERARYVSTEEKAEVLAYRLLLRLSAKIEDSTFLLPPSPPPLPPPNSTTSIFARLNLTF